MAPVPFLHVQLPSEDSTRELAGKIAVLLRAGDVLLLHGPVGAGKTFLVRAIIQARLAASDRLEDVPSPTFTLVQTYDDGAAEIWHADLYRLSGAGDVAELGLNDAFEHAISLVEWPDRLGPDIPFDALHLHFEYGPDDTTRAVEFACGAGDWPERLSSLTGIARLRNAG